MRVRTCRRICLCVFARLCVLYGKVWFSRRIRVECVFHLGKRVDHFIELNTQFDGPILIFV